MQQKADHLRRLNLAQLKFSYRFFFSFSFTIRRDAKSFLLHEAVNSLLFLLAGQGISLYFYHNFSFLFLHALHQLHKRHNVGKEKKSKTQISINRWCLAGVGRAAVSFHDRIQWTTLQDWAKHVVVHLAYFSFFLIANGVERNKKRVETSRFRLETKASQDPTHKHMWCKKHGTERVSLWTAWCASRFLSTVEVFCSRLERGDRLKRVNSKLVYVLAKKVFSFKFVRGFSFKKKILSSIQNT